MLKKQISREELDRLGEEIRRHFELHVVEQGLEYQQKGYVYNTEVVPGRAIVSKVQGGETYSVKLDLDFFGLSECSCPYEGCCKHMAAVFFYAFSVYGRPDAFVKDWKQRQEAPRPAARSGSRLHRQTALLPSAQPASPGLKESATPEEWLAHMEHEFASFAERHPLWKYDVDEYYGAALQTAIRPSTWWVPGAKQLLTLLGLVYAMRKLEHDYGSGGPGVAPRLLQYKETAESLERRLTETAGNTDADEAVRRWPEQLLGISSLVVASIAGRPAVPLVRWLDVYRLLWTRLLATDEWKAAEESAIGRRLAAARSESEEDDWRKARAHFHVMAGRDKEAWAELAQAGAFHPGEALYYTRLFSGTGQWERLWLWLQWLLPQCRKTDRDLFQTLCSHAADAAKELGREEEWARALVSMLPASYYVYTEFLVKSQRFRDWANYHLAERVAVFELYPADLRAAESYDPTVVFPLYHQSIDRCIMQKNRSSYKEAIRLMKKLGALYGQAGQTERYELFLHRLSLQYARLRAFREELTKGKLLR
ncbi:SWIM zinc finger domain-containing protein [Paenibacillus hodogayensis]|uniref:SWIM zinc finger domain-containing protein n=1 Tax=Paenibacillus hodogayensis TaxID=279208 RepID=A0ABV5W182_9BACL